jgi:tol-pal system protein YbgF
MIAKKLAAAGLLILTAACASTDDGDGPEPVIVPAQATSAEDPRVGELQTQLTELLECIDVLNHRIARLEETAPAPPPVQVAAAPAPAPVRTQQAAPVQSQPAPTQAALVSAKIAGDYRSALVLYGQSRLADARRAFQEVYEADQQGDLADNALFWIGETYFAAKDYVNAMRYYGRVTADYADQNKAPDAMLKTALAQEKTGDLALARRTMQQVIERYPYSSSASTAKQELQRIKY